MPDKNRKVNIVKNEYDGKNRWKIEAPIIVKITSIMARLNSL
jgi:hypothetical protein